MIFRDNWEPTFNADDNTFSMLNEYEDEQTIDYIMAMTNPVYSASFIQGILFDKAEVMNHVITVDGSGSGESEEMSFRNIMQLKLVLASFMELNRKKLEF